MFQKDIARLQKRRTEGRSKPVKAEEAPPPVNLIEKEVKEDKLTTAETLEHELKKARKEFGGPLLSVNANKELKKEMILGGDFKKKVSSEEAASSSAETDSSDGRSQIAQMILNPQYRES